MVGTTSYSISHVYHVFGFTCCASVDPSNDLSKILGTIFCAMAPIPMGALPNQEFSAMSKSFFKNFAATGQQATFIGLVLVIYPLLFIKIMEEVGSGIWGIIMGLTIYMLALLLSINKTKGWAKTLLSAS